MTKTNGLRKIHFSPVKLTLDDVYVIEKMLKDYFGECIIVAGRKKFSNSKELTEYLSDKSLIRLLRIKFGFNKIIFKSSKPSSFTIKVEREKTTIDLPDDAIKKGLYAELKEFLDTHAHESIYSQVSIFSQISFLLAIVFIPMFLTEGFNLKILYMSAISLIYILISLLLQTSFPLIKLNK